ncbi:Mov34/MPN/PAD-1 family protein [Psittacicella hinzii]|uniref:JAB domain-containing protein n=1 Tax=Psittacicella hinzii TaxID=2028575 RepID=A0A3A1YTU8_9GAMM|nr:Mov34/MPN/PAD-1 family protein [Psittacicella hinzii]RIY39477.1 hypothetical protein CKF58_02110 [Psittacicella hinzii]
MKLKISSATAKLIQEVADKDPEKEIAGILVKENGNVIFYELEDGGNEKNAIFNAERYLESVLNDTLVGLVHSHTKTSEMAFSEQDLAQIQFSPYPWLLFLANNPEPTYLYHDGVDYESDPLRAFSEKVPQCVRY